MHIYSHHYLHIALLQIPLALITLAMVFIRRGHERSDAWLRWASMAIAGYCFSTGARSFIIATFLLTNRFDITDYLLIVSSVCSIAVLVTSFLGIYHKRREAKLRLLPVTEAPVVDSWPPAPKAE
jgi:hypothetical protein